MANQNGRIFIDRTTTPPGGVEIADLQAVLGRSTGDEGLLVSDMEWDTEQNPAVLVPVNKINKWAKNKPIRYYLYDQETGEKTPYPGLLTAEMRKGPNVEQNMGIYYGIQVSLPEVTTGTDTWIDLHDSAFNYLHPRGLEHAEVLRRRDFEGYYHLAVPNPYASFGSDAVVGFLDRELGITGIMVQYLNSNTDGVDLSDALLGQSENKQTILSRTYPCILVDGYITALDFADIPDPAPRPLYYNNAYVSGSWKVDTRKTIYGSNPATRPWVGPTSGLHATLVLVRSARQNGITLDAQGSQDLAQYWIKCSDAFVAPRAPAPLPGAVDTNLSLVNWTNGISVYATSVTYNQFANSVMVALSWSGTTAGDGTFSASVTPTLIDQLSQQRSTAPAQSVAGRDDQPGLPGIAFPVQDFGIVHIPGQRQVFDIEVNVVTTDGPATNSTTYQGTLILT